VSKLRYWVDVAAFLVFAVLLAVNESWTPRFCVGMGIALVALVPWMIARSQLGASFTVTAQAKKLVTRGLYSRFRNPVYIFGQIAFLGEAISWNQPIGYLFVILSIPMQVFRMRNEAAVLEQAFGDEYRKYKAKTWF